MKYPKINYIGNKEKIADWIVNFIPAEVKSVLDAFSIRKFRKMERKHL